MLLLLIWVLGKMRYMKKLAILTFYLFCNQYGAEKLLARLRAKRRTSNKFANTKISEDFKFLKTETMH